MKIIDRIRRNCSFARLTAILSLAAMGAWLYAGTPIPGRYQIVNSGNSVTMIDTVNGKLRVFSIRRVGDNSLRGEGQIEVYELTK
jgi:hypothetical protein